ncbi:hypothetical protein BDW74DRAFT_67189 [Aspergillus multicolor]|uniref:uncharacterized protein n=1 Tax=Aspergillus multicolor TaxID=41759 RepID=UPI003CCD5A53
MLTSVLGAPMTTLHVQHPLVIPLTPAKLGRPGSLYRAHPCRENGISLWRPLREGLGAENGLFHVYPGSHMIQSEEELRASQIPPREVRINRDQVLVTRGGLWIQSGASGGGILMWMGFSTRMIGSGIDAYTLGVVVDAYNAMPLVQ